MRKGFGECNDAFKPYTDILSEWLTLPWLTWWGNFCVRVIIWPRITQQKGLVKVVNTFCKSTFHFFSRNFQRQRISPSAKTKIRKEAHSFQCWEKHCFSHYMVICSSTWNQFLKQKLGKIFFHQEVFPAKTEKNDFSWFWGLDLGMTTPKVWSHVMLWWAKFFFLFFRNYPTKTISIEVYTGIQYLQLYQLRKESVFLDLQRLVDLDIEKKWFGLVKKCEKKRD